jgi:micrococcal nuclease
MNKFNKKSAASKFILVIFFSALLIRAVNCEEKNGKWRVVWVVDGDTIIVKNKNIKEKVRLKGVDAPEIAHPEFGQHKIDYFGEESSQCLLNILREKTVTLKYDTNNTREKDKYGRLLAYVHLDEIDVNAKIIGMGCARAMKNFPHSRLNYYKDLEKTAKTKKLGMWK